jgi:hypothetical protein
MSRNISALDSSLCMPNFCDMDWHPGPNAQGQPANVRHLDSQRGGGSLSRKKMKIPTVTSALDLVPLEKVSICEP